ncbi:hypothetical protein JD79_00946 [Geodermatophilus normandii]|uniref:Uncharacterized protein n=1 Tax=Geodermatophilus normandii TaxID=1137989 RepID=A0A317QHR8_9ACTN|nr:GNAT family protein [Geodermatophilus normandii]PWW21805.1 hypothetical protein JD79_00946 [Geodermatophilus normandii]
MTLPEYRGNGLGTVVGTVVLDRLLEGGRVTRVVGAAPDGKAASRRVAAKVGYRTIAVTGVTKVGLLRRKVDWRNREQDRFAVTWLRVDPAPHPDRARSGDRELLRDLEQALPAGADAP